MQQPQQHTEDYWLTKLFNAQEIRLHPPCHQEGEISMTQCERCIFTDCRQAALITAQAQEHLSDQGFPKFKLSH